MGGGGTGLAGRVRVRTSCGWEGGVVVRSIEPVNPEAAPLVDLEPVSGDRLIRSHVFKVETMVGGQWLVRHYATKRWAKVARKSFGGFIRRGPEHRRGETGATTHTWFDDRQGWVRLTERQSRLVGLFVRESNRIMMAAGAPPCQHPIPIHMDPVLEMLDAGLEPAVADGP